MRNNYLFVALLICLAGKLSAQGTGTAPQLPVDIQIAPPSVINFQQLADWEKLNPVEEGEERFIEQEEDRDEEFHFKGLPVPADAEVQKVEIPAAQNQHQRNSPAPLGTWDGIMQLTSQLIPPDIRGAASVGNFVMQTTNKQFKVFNKTGTLLSTLSITTFFNSTGGSGYFDPHIIYDNNNNRFVVCIAGNVSSGNSGLFVGVSQTSDPTGSWYVYGFDAIGNANDFLDYPLLGLNTNWVVVTGNDFLGNGGNSSKIYVMNRATLYAGTLGTVSTFTDNNLFTIAPAHTFDTGQTIEYLVSDYNGNSGGSGYVNIGYINGTVNAPAYNAGTPVGVNQPWSENNVGALQLGSGNDLEDGDTRIGNALVINGSMWFTHTVFLPAASPTHDAVDWWQINPATRAIQQFGRVEDTNGPKFFFYPSISVNANGDALLGYCQSSASLYAGAAYSFHAASDAASTMQTTYLYKAGTAGYYQTLGGGRNRWGDYTGTAVDPSDNSFFGFGEWAAGGALWGTEIVHVAASSATCEANAAFTYSNTVSCSAPLTVSFTNNSTSANTYLWSFGDGTTSTLDNPSHTYTVSGIYSVKLVATSTGTCGKDSITMSNLVNISSANPCIVILPSTGSATTQTSCSGIIYDDGGLSSNYTDNSNSTLTISPTGASQVRLSFSQFRMESGYDYLYVYDGPTTASTQIGAYTGTTLPATVTSSGPSITIRQYSDANLNDAGFTINWSCILPNSPPVANLSADFTSSCTGAVTFTNLTTGGATSWLWNFGDGTTSTLQTPSHVYQANGTFTVTLTATNAFGSNTATKTNYITISRPTGPTVSGATPGCAGTSFTLTAASSGNPVTWFNSSGTSVSTENPFVTPAISSTTTYYVEDTVAGSSLHVGPVNNAFGTGGYLTASQYLIFNVMRPCVLQSVYVYANGAGNRTFQLRDKNLNVVASQVINVPNGGSRVTLNFNLSTGDSFQLGFPSGSTINLYRNDASATFPYTDIDNNVSIIGNTAAIATRYYFCYDWIIQEKCVSLRTPVTLTVSPAVTATTTVTNVPCHGANSGSATVTPSGGTPTYSYHWNNNASTATASGLTAGIYAVTVTDAVGCTVQKGVIISEPTAISVTSTVTNVLCNGRSTGAIGLTVSGGTPSYSYNWGGGITTQNRLGIAAGNYVVTVTDASSCSASLASTVSQPTAISVGSNITNVSCNAGTNGSITLNVSGGTPAYTYNWGGGITAQNRTSLAAGNYSVTTTDANSCTATAAFTVSQPNALSIPVTSSNATCNIQNGSASVNASGGSAPYSYIWSNGQTTSSISNLAAGNYSVTVSDNSSCSASASTTVTSSGSFSVNGTAVNASCFGNNDGGVTLTTNGAVAPVTYSWSNGGNSSSILNVAAGSYTATVTDGTGCSVTISKNVSQPSTIAASITSTNATCNSNNGSALLSVIGGTPTYSYLWSNGGSAAQITNLAAGTYSVTITDNNQCTGTASVNISSSSTLATNVQPGNITCFGLSNGGASVTITGGTQPFTYSWSNGLNFSSVSNLAAGSYSVTVHDANNCSSVSTFTISQPTVLSAGLSANNVSCFGAADGSATATASGGTPGYSYQWCNGSSTSTATNLGAGNCSVTVSDANNCTSSFSVSISEPAQLQYTTSVVDANAGMSNGSATVTPSGGVAPYSTQWSNGGDGTNLAAGTYSFTVTDNNGCIKTGSVTVNEITGIEDVKGDLAFTVYPNPATNELTLSLDKLKGRALFSLKNVLGQVVLNRTITSSLTTFDLSSLATGVYLVEVRQGNQKSVKEIVVAR